MGRGIFLEVIYIQTIMEDPSAFQFGGSLVFVFTRTPFVAATKFDVVTHMRRELVVRGPTR